MGHRHVRDLPVLVSRPEHQWFHSGQRRSQLAVQAADSRPRVGARLLALGGEEESSGGPGHQFQVMNFLDIDIFFYVSVSKRKRAEREKKIERKNTTFEIQSPDKYICMYRFRMRERNGMRRTSRTTRGRNDD